METVYDRVKRVVVDKLSVKDPTTVQEDSSFEEDLKADSLDLVELIMELEKEFEEDVDEKFRNAQGLFRVPDEDAGKLHTVKDVVTYIEGRLKKEAAAA